MCSQPREASCGPLPRAAPVAGSVHSVHLSHLKPHELRTISRLRFTTHDLEEPAPPPARTAVVRTLRWGLLCRPAEQGRCLQYA